MHADEGLCTAHVTQVSYYMAEYTEEEIQRGLGTASMKFAQESKSQRGSFRRGASRNAANAANATKNATSAMNATKSAAAVEVALASPGKAAAAAGKGAAAEGSSDSGSGSDNAVVAK